jgi:hypothetical protein
MKFFLRKKNDEAFSPNSSQINKLHVEVLLVTDLSVYIDHQRFSGSNDRHVVFMHMKIYFSHLMNGVLFVSIRLNI